MRNYQFSDHKNHWKDSDVEAHWDRVAGIYVAENNKVKAAHDQRFHESMLHLRLSDAHNILNITSRDAEAEDYIKKQYPNVSITHAEISEGLMAEALRLRPGIQQQKIQSYSNLPFEDKSFDRILSLETLEHVADPMAFLNELHRISKPEALLVLSCPPATSEIPYQLYTSLFGGHGEGPHRFLASAEVKVMFSKSRWKLLFHKGTVLFPVGPPAFQQLGERIINAFQGSLLAELGIRQFFVCEKY